MRQSYFDQLQRIELYQWVELVLQEQVAVAFHQQFQGRFVIRGSDEQVMFPVHDH